MNEKVNERVAGEKGSEQNELRSTLYCKAIERCTQAIKSGFHLEAITLCESMIADRIEALLQTIDHGHSNPAYVMSLSNAITVLNR